MVASDGPLGAFPDGAQKAFLFDDDTRSSHSPYEHSHYKYIGQPSQHHRAYIICWNLGALGQPRLFYPPLNGGSLAGLLYRWMSHQPTGPVFGDVVAATLQHH